jgi:succinate dehydrogenase / fumarate reductase cytochrome b subunit
MLKRFLTVMSSSVMKKQIMGITGLMLCGFLVTHMAGNFLIFVGPEAFNTYAYTLTSNPLIYVAEAVLAAIFLTHIGLAMKLTIENKMARPTNYYMRQTTGRGSTLASSTMPITGLLILVFLVFHILHLKFGPEYPITHSGVEMRDLYRLLVEYFSSKLAVAWYILCMAGLALHVSHGFWSAFQSIGFNHPKYMPLLQVASKLYALAMFFGFSSFPIYLHLQGGN